MTVDYFYRWATSSDARADAFAAAQHFGISSTAGWAWERSHVLPDVQAWRPSQDSTTISVSTVDGSTVRTITHNYLTGWFAIVATNNPVPVLLNSTALAFACNREAAGALTSTGGHVPFILKNNIGAVITDVACSPIFAGSHYPIGGYST